MVGVPAPPAGLLEDVVEAFTFELADEEDDVPTDGTVVVEALPVIGTLVADELEVATGAWRGMKGSLKLAAEEPTTDTGGSVVGPDVVGDNT